MKTTSFVAHSAVDVMDQVRQQLGSRARILQVRRLPGVGLSRFWQKPRIEVLAGVEAEPSDEGLMADLLQRIARLNRQLPPVSPDERTTVNSLLSHSRFSPTRESAQGCQVSGVRCQGSGFSAATESAQTQEIIARSVREPAWRTSTAHPQTHLLVGAPGVGKTTCLSKWLAQVVLLGGRSARIWRLDGRIANPAESLGVYAEILGVPVSRSWSEQPPASAWDIGFIDLPGVDCQEEGALEELAASLPCLGLPFVHLVLNAAYESSLLREQIQRFSTLPITDLIFTHLDEDWGLERLGQLASSSGHPVAFLSAGQNVPGIFRECCNSDLAGKASAEKGSGL